MAPKGSTYYEFNITIVDDNRLERDELFRVNVVQPMSPVNTMNCVTDIIIMDDDGT